MPLNLSGPISLGGSTTGQSINLELGQSATAQVSLNNTNVRTLAAVPSGAIVMPTNFYGKGGATISITDQSIDGFGLSSSGAWYYLTSGGVVQGSIIFGGTSQFFIENWVTPTSAASDYEAFVTVTSGSLTGGTTGSWVALSSTRSWYIQSVVTGLTTCVFTVQIRRVGTGTVLDTATITLTADVSD
jgi:hypothetical protein